MKKKVLQKVLTLSLAGVMAMGSLAACGTGNATGTSSVETSAESSVVETTAEDTTEASEENTAVGMESWEAFTDQVTLTVPVYDRPVEGVPDLNDNYWTKWIQENFGDTYNIKVEFEPIIRNDVMTSYSLLAAGDDLPTILMEYDYPKLAQWASDGYLITYDTEEFAKVAPTYYNKMVENDQLQYSVLGGETYFALAERPYWNANYTNFKFVRMDWLREVGYDYVPVLHSEYLDAMTKIQEAGLSTNPAGGSMLVGQGADQNYSFRTFPLDEAEWAMYSSVTTYALGTDADYAYLKRENEKYDLGILNPEYYITDLETNRAAFISGETYEYTDYITADSELLNAFYANNPDAELAIAPVAVLDEEGGTTPGFRVNNPFGMIIGFSSQATEDEILAAWMYMEWMLQEDVLFTMQWGIEGENYTVDAETGLPVSVGDYSGDYKQGYNNSKDYWCVAVESRNAGTIEQIIAAISPKGLPQDFTQDIIDIYYDQVALAAEGWGIPDPIFAVSIQAEADNSATLMSTYIELRDNLVRCAPEAFDALYEESVQKYLDKGLQEVIDEKLAAYESGQSTKLPENIHK